MLEYVAMIVGVAVLTSSVVVVATNSGPPMARALWCAVQSVFQQGQPCPDSGDASGSGQDGGSGGTAGGSGGGSGDGSSGQDPTDCDDVIYSQNTVYTEVRVNCVWYPLNPECQDEAAAIAGWQPDKVVPDDQKDAAQKVAECVTAGVGPISGNQDDPACNKTTIMNGVVSKDPPFAQVGCTSWVVPVECKGEWAAWQVLSGTSPAGDRDKIGRALQKCMENFYANNETACVVSSETTTSHWGVTMLFFLRIEGSNGVLVEKLGDGRWQVHTLDGHKIGASVNSPELPSDKVGFEMGLLALAGWSADDTYQFGDQASAEAWVKWYQSYISAVRAARAAPSAPQCFHGECIGKGDLLREANQLKNAEPKRKRVSKADARTMTVSAHASLDNKSWFGGSASYTREGTVENRYNTDGSKSSTLTMKNEGAVDLFLRLAKGSTPKGKEGEPGDVAGAIQAAAGAGGAGSVSLTAFYNPDGTLNKVIMSVDTTFMGTLAKLDPSVSVKLPYGFSVDAGFTYQKQMGKTSIQQNVIDVGTHENLRDSLQATMAKIFPQGKDGKFTNDAPMLDFDDGGIGDLVGSVGTTRNLNYDVESQDISGHVGLSFAGLPLFDVSGGQSTESRGLTGSSLDVIDVNGNTQTMNPSPKCHDKQIDPNTYPYDKQPYTDRA